MRLRDIYKNAVALLESSGIDDAEFEARIIIEHIFGVKSGDLFLNPDIELSEEKKALLTKLIDERTSGRPLQYIIGSWEFMGIEFEVGEGVLIPRPETEILVEYAVDKLKNKSQPVVFDLCSGSGCIGLSVKKLIPSARVFMVEISDNALFFLNRNREKLNLMRDTCVIKGDILKGYSDFSALPKPDVIVSNPPYIKTEEIASLQKEVQREPSLALDGGKDGFDFYRVLANDWLPYVNEGGFIAVECGEEQAEDITAMFLENCIGTEIINDFSGIQRIVAGKK